MTEKQFSKMLDLWNECEKHNISRTHMHHMSEIIEASPYFDETVDLYAEIVHKGAIPFIKGTPRKISLFSRNISFRPCLEPSEEISQRLTVTANGKVYVTRYDYYNNVLQKQRKKISKQEAKELLDKICSHLTVNFSLNRCFDTGTWNVDVTDTGNKTYHLSGDLVGGCDKWLDGISDDIRYLLDMPDLFCFNADCAEKVLLCSCEFEYGGKRYCYKTKDKSIQPGDEVVVPVGQNNTEKTVRVTDTEYIAENELPTEFGEIKEIIRKSQTHSFDEENFEPKLANDNKTSAVFSEEKSLFDIIKSQIDHMDCEGLLEIGAPSDEYDCETAEIAAQLHPNMDIHQIASVIAEVITANFNRPFSSASFIRCAAIIKEQYAELYQRQGDNMHIVNISACYARMENRQVKITQKNEIKIEGKLIDWTSAYDNDPDPESITVRTKDDFLVEVYIKDIRSIELIFEKQRKEDPL